MSRNGVDVVRRGLQLSTASQNLILPLLGSHTRVAFFRPAFREYSSIPQSSTPSHRSDLIRFQYVTDSDTSIRWPRSSALNTAGLGLRRNHYSHSRASQQVARQIFRLNVQRKWYSDSKTPASKTSADEASRLSEQTSSIAAQKSRTESSTITDGDNQSKSFYDRLPHLHRPSKEELLAAATGFWHRMQIRFKWFSIRSVRPFTHEEIFAFLSWIFWGHVLWFVIGTTTFVSLTILALNTVFAQETLAGWVGNYLTKSSGLNVVFESAIVPRWSNSVITFNKVFVSRRPDTEKRQRSVRKGSSETEAAVAAATAQTEKDKQRENQALLTENEDNKPVDDGNYTQFDVTIENVEVTLSFTKWFNGKGLLRDVSVKGVRGVVDRTFVQPRSGYEDPKSYRHEHNTGDFEIDNFKMEDVLLTVYQPNNFRPFSVSVFNCELPRLRKQWLFFDFLSANTVHGSFDNSLFTIHPRQVHGTTGVPLVKGREEEASQWKKHSRLRIDALNIDHLNRGVEGPFSWIHEGNVDIVADVMIPNDADGSIAKVMSDFYDRMEATVINQTHGGPPVPQQPDNTANTGHSIKNTEDSLDRLHDNSEELVREEDNRFLVMDVQIHLNDVRASVPIFTRDISYVNNAAVRPIVAYINSHSYGSRNYIPISCRIVKRLSEFDGSWTVFDCGMLDDVSRETYEAFVRDIMDRKQRTRRIKKVGLWAAQVAAQALFIGLAGQLA